MLTGLKDIDYLILWLFNFQLSIFLKKDEKTLDLLKFFFKNCFDGYITIDIFVFFVENLVL